MPSSTGTLVRWAVCLSVCFRAGVGSAAELGGSGAPVSESVLLVMTPATSRSATPAVTRPLTWFDVPLRSHSPTSPAGKQQSSPGTTAHQVCHHARCGLTAVAAGTGHPAVATGAVHPAVWAGGATSECCVQATPSQ